MRKNKFICLFIDARVKNKNIDLNLFYSYVIFTNARVGNIRSWIFTDARDRSITFFLFARYLPTPKLKIFVGIVHWQQSQEHEKKDRKGKREQILNNFR
jgi:hypothetical protein